MVTRRRPAAPLLTASWLVPLVFVALLLLTDATALGAGLSAVGAGVGGYLGQRWSVRRWESAQPV